VSGEMEIRDVYLRQVLDAMPHKVWVVRTTGAPIYYNPAMRAFAGVALELPDRSNRERALLHPDDLEPFVIARTAATNSKHDWAVEARMRCPDGSYRWHRLNFSLLTPTADREVWLATATDIDDLQRALAAAQEREEQLRLAAEAAQLGVYTFDLETGEHSWSAELKTIFGLCRDSSPPVRIVESIHPDDRCRFEALRAASFDPRGDGVFQDEHRIIRPDGSERWVFVKGRVTFAHKPNRKAKRGLGLVIDITERKLAEQAISESESRYRMLFENAKDIVTTLELDGRIVSINPAAREILGYEPEELIGKTIYEFVPREQMSSQVGLLQRKLEGEAATQYDLEVVTKDGRRRTLEVSSRLVFDVAGKPVLIHSIARDVTERKDAETRQLVLVRELQHRTKNLLAVVQAIASRTLTTHPDLSAFIGRLHALAHAQDFVTSGPSGGVALRQLVEAELDAFAGRAQIQGEDVMLAGSFAQTFALVIHELATNALKYGALLSEKGTVAVKWQTRPDSTGGELRFFWSERGGPLVRTPKRKGFGTVLISTVGKARMRFIESGFEYETQVPLTEALEINSQAANSSQSMLKPDART